MQLKIILISLMFFNYNFGFADRIIPEKDLVYEGAFRVPAGSRNGIDTDTWAYGISGLGFNPEGNGGQGTLLSSNHRWKANKVEEISIPTPVNSPTKNVNELNRAVVIQPFTDITEGQIDQGNNIGDVTYLPAQGNQDQGKLYWIHYTLYMPIPGHTGIGWSNPDFSNLQAKGGWDIEAHTATSQQYITVIPKEFADTNLNGQYLGIGRERVQGANVRGPGLYSIAPWADGTPPADGTTLTSTELLHFDSTNYRPSEYLYSNQTTVDIAWVDIGDKEAVLFFGNLGMRTTQGRYPYKSYKTSFYPEYEHYKSNGDNFMDPMIPLIMFYDTDMIKDKLEGKISNEDIFPYSIINLKKYLFCPIPVKGDDGEKIIGSAFDQINLKLYVLEKSGDGNYPLIHVFKVQDSGEKKVDFKAPSKPSNISNVDSLVTWTGSVDDNGDSDDILYIVYKQYSDGLGEWRPVYGTMNTFWDDPGYTTGDKYRVGAMDGSFNLIESTPIDSTPVFIMNHPRAQTVSSGEEVIFYVTADGARPITYQWKKNGIDIPGESGSTYILNSANENGNVYSCTVQNPFGVAVTKPATLTVGVQTLDTESPTVPTNLQVTVVSSTQIDLTWTASTDNIGVTGYKILPGTGTSFTPTYSVTELSPNTQYSFTVKAYDAAGNESSESIAVQITTNDLPIDSITVSNISEFISALTDAHNGGVKTILLEDGIYTISSQLNIYAEGITVGSVSGNRDAVIIEGDGMYGNVGMVFYVEGNNFTLKDVTIKNVKWHTMQLFGADGIHVSNVHLTDSKEQLFKGAFNSATPSITSDNGIIENCLFSFSAGIAEQNYTGGIDVHRGSNWIVRNNTFQDIKSPSSSMAEHAIHFWNNSSNTLVEGNTIINCDRGIGFGLGSSGHDGGVIRNNMIYHDSVEGFDDVAIGLESSPNTLVYNNTIYMENDYPNAIEYRWSATSNVSIINNLTNKNIQVRDGASGTELTNITNAQGAWFVDINSGNLRLSSSISSVVDQGQTIAEVLKDIDGDLRPVGSSYDIGADEYTPSIEDLIPPTIPSNLQATAVSYSQIDLTWDTSTDNVGVTGYKIYRDNIEIATTTQVSYSNTGLSPNTQYSYTISALDAAGNESTISAPQNVTTLEQNGSVDLAAYWNFDGTADDSSGNNHHGTINGPIAVTGKKASAFDFDGVDDNVFVNSFDILGDKISIAMWINIDDFDIYDARLISKATGSQEMDHTWMISTITTSEGMRLRMRMKTNGNTSTLIASSGLLVTNQWIHVTAVYNGSTMKLYQDGVEVGSMAKSGDISSGIADINIGRSPDGYGPFDGTIDDVRIYNIALNQAQINELITPSTRNTPVIDPINPIIIYEGEKINLNISVTDLDAGDLITLKAQNLPIGSDLTDNQFSWQTDFQDAGIYTVTFIAYDQIDYSDPLNVNITVKEISTDVGITNQPANDKY